MSYTWITPKIDWVKATPFSYTDFNRIRNNILYLNDMINEMYPDSALILDLGEAKTGYADNYSVRVFNAIENALESFVARTGQNLNIGEKKTFYGNGRFIDANELNRIERCCLNWKKISPNVSSVTINHDDIVIWTKTTYSAETVQLSATVLPDSAPQDVTWSSSNASVATVSSTGLVTRVGRGTAMITASAGGKTSSIFVTVNYGVTNVTISDSEWKASKIGDTKRLSISITPSNATGYELKWSSSNTSCATVSDNGLVTLVGRGEATISATITEPHFSDNTFTVSCSVSVTAGSYFVYEGTNYPCDMIYLGSNLDGTGKSTLLFRYMTKSLMGKWNSFDDSTQPYRTVISNFVNKNFSTDLKGALQSATKVVLSGQKGTSTKNLTAKFFLPSRGELNNDSPNYRPKLGNVTYSYFDTDEKRVGSVTERIGASNPYSRSCGWYEGQTYPELLIMMGATGGVPLKYQVTLRPLFFLLSSLHVYDTPNGDGSYSIDWSGESNTTLANLTVGTIIRDDTGAGRIG